MYTGIAVTSRLFEGHGHSSDPRGSKLERKLPKYSNLFDTSTPETQSESLSLFKLKPNQCDIALKLSDETYGKFPSFPQQPTGSCSIDFASMEPVV